MPDLDPTPVSPEALQVLREQAEAATDVTVPSELLTQMLNELHAHRASKRAYHARIDTAFAPLFLEETR
jgi:hypothetical protein